MFVGFSILTVVGERVLHNQFLPICPPGPTLTQACTSENYRHFLHGVTRSERHGMNTSVSILRFYIRPEKHTKGFELF